ncbi:lysophospholipid acyltransferase family protein, partial [Pseudoxanthomonas winnipegensis]|uniref:lysophospholipid acyltransferase family protein n=1 Tax=Pseudoxanthomonas winnipegensis TaxID=2480810 RepID=UPI003D110ACE
MQPSRSLGQLAWGAWNLLQLAFTLLWTATLCSLVLLLYVLGVPVARLLRMAPRVWAPVLVAGAGARLVVEGGQDIDWSRPHLIVSNHQSVIDICALYMAVPVPRRFLLTDEMRKVPFVYWYARATGMLFLDRDSRRAGGIVRRQAAALLAAGQTLCLFPEGRLRLSRAVAPDMACLLPGALDGGLPWTPSGLVVCGTVRPPRGLSRGRPGTIRLRTATPLDPHQPGDPLDRQALTQR